MDKIIVVGGGGHAKVLISILKKTRWDILGYTDNQDRGPILGTPYLGNDEILESIIRKSRSCRAVVGMGKIDTTQVRLTLQHQIELLGFEFPAVISPSAVVNEDVKLSAGTLVCDGVVVNSGAITGKACIINSNSTVEHDSHIGDNVHIAPGATLSGGVKIGHHCLIGTGANVIQNINICENCLVGAGSTVIKDITVPGIYVGNPARKVK